MLKKESAQDPIEDQEHEKHIHEESHPVHEK